MPEPLTIYECSAHGPQSLHPGECDGLVWGLVCGLTLEPVRVFREKDVRPLWEAAHACVDDAIDPEHRAAVDAFPALDEA